MCIVQGETEKIANTQIFVAQTKGGNQFTIYSNEIHLATQNTTPTPFSNTSSTNTFLFPKATPTNEFDSNVAMILPVPSKLMDGSDIKIIDLSNHKNIFKDLDKLFPQPRSLSYGSTRSNGPPTKSYLPISQHGSYDVTIVPKLSDFPKLNHKHFKLDAGVSKLLHRDYLEGFSFIVCKIRQNADYHPFGYIHPMIKENIMFIPTKHYHNNSESHADWDHNIYTMNADINMDARIMGIRMEQGSSILKDTIPLLPVHLMKNDVSDLKRIKVGKLYNQNHDFEVSCKA